MLWMGKLLDSTAERERRRDRVSEITRQERILHTQNNKPLTDKERK